MGIWKKAYPPDLKTNITWKLMPGRCHFLSKWFPFGWRVNFQGALLKMVSWLSDRWLHIVNQIKHEQNKWRCLFHHFRPLNKMVAKLFRIPGSLMEATPVWENEFEDRQFVDRIMIAFDNGHLNLPTPLKTNIFWKRNIRTCCLQYHQSWVFQPIFFGEYRLNTVWVGDTRLY